jgi:hypothetical protein
MKTPPVVFAVTVANAAMFVYSIAQPYRTAAQENIAALRARSLEIVDTSGRVRAELKVTPADPNVKMPDGSKGYPETVLFRLITSKGGPNVKLAAPDDGAGLVLGSDKGYIQVLSRQTNPFIKVVNNDGRETIVKPQ